MSNLEYALDYLETSLWIERIKLEVKAEILENEAKRLEIEAKRLEKQNSAH